MSDFFTRKMGPLPMWAWGLIIFGVAYWYLAKQKKAKAAAAAAQAAAQNQGTSSNLGTVPVSNLQTSAQPMPIQLGDTFVNTGQGGGISTTSGSPATTLISSNPPTGVMATANPPATSAATNV